MEPVELQAIIQEMGRAIDDAVEQLREAQEREFVGTAADGLVTATLAAGQLEVDIHVLAKRRLDREDLEAAIVEAVHSAEQQAADVPIVTGLENRAQSAMGDKFYAAFNDAMRETRSRLQ
jgi:DNA-binding protein YbaB